jgi:membrane protein CcdC involved in cytochrome C biogenesis
MLIPASLIVNLFFFGFTVWLGAYLLARTSQKGTVRLTGWGLIFYAAALAIEILGGETPGSFLLLPGLFWIGATLYLFPEETVWRAPAIRIWAMALLPLFILSLLNLWFSLIVVGVLLACVILIGILSSRSPFKRTFAVLTVIGLFFSLSTGLVILPLNWVPRSWMVPALGLDLFLLGIVITVWDAFEEGESIRSHLTRSWVTSFYYAGVLAILVFMAVVIDGELTPGKLTALVLVIGFGILAQIFSNPIQAGLDRLTMSHDSAMVNERAILRQTADVLPRLSILDPSSMDETEFARLTRRAIANLGDLPKLSTSPLINLPAIASQNINNPLDRAHTLRSLLIESIRRLKPQGTDDFGTTDEWRYYNALYFPYVVGLKPYTRRNDQEIRDDASRQALEWFQTSIPERTLHNWQNTAAKLVANDLRNKT